MHKLPKFAQTENMTQSRQKKLHWYKRKISDILAIFSSKTWAPNLIPLPATHQRLSMVRFFTNKPHSNLKFVVLLSHVCDTQMIRKTERATLIRYNLHQFKGGPTIENNLHEMESDQREGLKLMQKHTCDDRPVLTSSSTCATTGSQSMPAPAHYGTSAAIHCKELQGSIRDHTILGQERIAHQAARRRETTRA